MHRAYAIIALAVVVGALTCTKIKSDQKFWDEEMRIRKTLQERREIYQRSTILIKEIEDAIRKL